MPISEMPGSTAMLCSFVSSVTTRVVIVFSH